MYYHAEEKEKAEQAWRKSLDMAPSAWAYRNLAVLAKAADRTEETTALWEAACRMAPGQPALAIECGNAFLDAGNPAGLLDLLPALETEVRERPRIRIFEARAALEVGDLDRVERILRGDFELTDLREGEVILTDLWFGMYEKRIATAKNIPIDDTLKERVRREFPPPAQIDFRAFAKHK